MRAKHQKPLINPLSASSMFIFSNRLGVHQAEDSALLSPTWDFDGVFETLLWDGVTLLDWQLHRNRVAHSLESLFGVNEVLDELPQWVNDLVRKNEIKGTARVRYMVAPDGGAMHHSIVVQPYQRHHGAVDIVTSQFAPDKNRQTKGHKSTQYLAYANALREAQSEGAGEALLFNSDQQLCEAATSNVFFVKSGVVHTPGLATGCLPGIMRSIVLDRLTRGGVDHHQGVYSKTDIVDAEAVFITNSLRRIQVVKSIDGFSYAPVNDDLLALMRD